MPKPLTYDQALAKLARLFPGHEVTVYDGDGEQESGLVEAAGGDKVASFRLTLRHSRAGGKPETLASDSHKPDAQAKDSNQTVRKIRVGAVGQFCGTADEIRAWEQSRADPIYLDYNASTPLDPRVLTAMTPWFLAPANAGSRTHEYGRRAKEALEKARAQVAAVVHAQPEEIVFTSGATESNNLTLLGLKRFGEASNRRHILSTAIEHKAVLEPLEQLSAAGFEVELAPVTSGGYVEPDEIRRRLRPDTLLVSVMHANNETGVLQPVLEIGRLLAGTPTLFHVDAAQTFGKEGDAFASLDCDFLSISGHKIYGPQGIGALLVRRRSGQPRRLHPLFFGGGQERGLRPGTVPVALAVGLGEAARLAAAEWPARRRAALALRVQLLSDLQSVPHRINGDPARCQPHVLNVSFPGIDSEALMLALRDTVAISNGSACTSSSYKPSHVLVAMGLDEGRICNAVRISYGHATELNSAVNRARAFFQLKSTIETLVAYE